MTYMWMSEDSLQKSVLSFRCAVPGSDLAAVPLSAEPSHWSVRRRIWVSLDCSQSLGRAVILCSVLWKNIFFLAFKVQLLEVSHI